LKEVVSQLEEAGSSDRKGIGTYAIDVQNLRKVYSRGNRQRVAVDDLTFQVPWGTCFGLVGPNGAGKTSTIRVLLGLVRPSSGTCRILGAKPGNELSEVIDEIGVVQEGQGFFPNSSGRDNLAYLALLRGFDKGVIEDVLDVVGLAKAKDLDFSKYSLGMKQRLGIAAALLKDPKLLIMDEPSNGLDPRGLFELRDIMSALRERGKTILLCSHLLSEVQTVCDWIAIISDGVCVATGELAALLESMGNAALLIKIRQKEKALKLMSASGYLAESAGDAIRVLAPPSDGEKIIRILAKAGIYPQELRADTSDLEDVFLRLVSKEGH